MLHGLRRKMFAGVAFGLVTAIIPAAAVAQGPNRNEMTGPTIVDDTLFIAVQHPGEDTPIRATAAETQSRRIQILEGDGSGTFEQKRTITKGSQWPSNIQGSRAPTRSRNRR